MSVEHQKQEVEQNPLVENSSSVNVKTPLVDALRSYFAKQYELAMKDVSKDIHTLGFSNG